MRLREGGSMFKITPKEARLRLSPGTEAPARILPHPPITFLLCPLPCYSGFRPKLYTKKKNSRDNSQGVARLSQDTAAPPGSCGCSGV